MKLKQKLNKLRYKLESKQEDIRCFFENIVAFVERLITYVPFLWRDRDWDYGFLEELMLIKLKRMAHRIKENNIIESSDRVAKQINYAVYLLERIRSGQDLNEAVAKHEAKWGKSYRTFETSKKNPEYRVWAIHYPNAVTEELKEQAYKEITDAYKAVMEKESELYDRLFRHLRKYWCGFWD